MVTNLSYGVSEKANYSKRLFDWCHERGVDFWAVNKDYPEEEKEKKQSFFKKVKGRNVYR